MKYWMLILLLLVELSSLAQKKSIAIVSTPKTLVFYCGIDIPLEVMTEGSPQKKFTVKVDSAAIKKIDQYVYRFRQLKLGLLFLL